MLRIEDTDLGRARDHFVDAIYDDLSWLGLAWPEPVRRQSEHLDDYRAALEKLWRSGLIYPAPATRSEINKFVIDYEKTGAIWPKDPDGAPHYPFTERDRGNRPIDMPENLPLRLDLDAALKATSDADLTARYLAAPEAPIERRPMKPSIWGDVLLRGRDRPATYHLAVVVDDDIQNITHVVRGLDIEPATALHRLLQELLGLSDPIYHHHQLMLGADGRKLSKSDSAKSLRHLRDAGLTVSDIFDRLR